MLGKTKFLAVLGVAALLTTGVSAQDAPGPGGPGGARPGPRGGRAGPDFFARHDANHDGKVTLEEIIAQAKKLIEAGDADEDGALTREEFEAARRKMREAAREGGDRPEGEGPPEGAGPGEKGPPDGRGPGAGRRGGGARGGRPGADRPDLEEVFKRMDKDGNGQISLEEWKAAHEGRGPGDGDRRGPPGGRGNRGGGRR